ncbi:TVP38/TMEM64 family protein [Planctomycetes bacterium K23_9]|uniref:TVP38/TMEM64 family membrane protein n=1 Tax=Stieleria marina TaxID=1930275 RepID=A0A517NNL4_9BACT|nr:SNARE associated Golgi protein [Planctomycetes bacterium K23_9]
MNKLIAEISPASDPTRLRRKFARWLFLCCLLFIGVTLVATGGKLTSLQSWLNEAGMKAPVLFVLAAIVLMSVILPKTLVSISAGALFGTATGAWLITIIAVTAAAINYVIGRWCLSVWIDEKVDRRPASQAIWPRVLRDLATHGGLGFHLMFRFAPIPSMIVNYSMGASKARVTPFLVGALVGVLPQLLWVHGGTLANESQAADIGSWQFISAAVSILAAIAISVLVPREVMRRIEIENSKPACKLDPPTGSLQ